MVNSRTKAFRTRGYYVPTIWNITKEAEKRIKKRSWNRLWPIS
jgi:hypothetical protein